MDHGQRSHPPPAGQPRRSWSSRRSLRNWRRAYRPASTAPPTADPARAPDPGHGSAAARSHAGARVDRLARSRAARRWQISATNSRPTSVRARTAFARRNCGGASSSPAPSCGACSSAYAPVDASALQHWLRHARQAVPRRTRRGLRFNVSHAEDTAIYAFAWGATSESTSRRRHAMSMSTAWPGRPFRPLNAKRWRRFARRRDGRPSSASGRARKRTSRRAAKVWATRRGPFRCRICDGDDALIDDERRRPERGIGWRVLGPRCAARVCRRARGRRPGLVGIALRRDAAVPTLASRARAAPSPTPRCPRLCPQTRGARSSSP